MSRRTKMNTFQRLLAAVLLALAPLAAALAPASALAQAPAPAQDAQPAAAAPAQGGDASKGAAPAATPAAPAGAGQDATTQKEVVDNPYGLEALWRGGDFVSRGTLIILVIMSMGSWYIMFVKVYEQAKLFRQSRAIQADFWKAASLQEGVQKQKAGTAFRYIA